MKCIFFWFDSTAGTQSELLKQVDPKGVIEFRAVASYFSPPVRWGLLDFMLVVFSFSLSSFSFASSSFASTASSRVQCSLPAGPQPRAATSSVPCRSFNREQPRPAFPTGPQPRAATSSVPYRTSTATLWAQCSLPDLNREIECQKICQKEYKASICLRQHCWTVWQSTGLFFFRWKSAVLTWSCLGRCYRKSTTWIPFTETTKENERYHSFNLGKSIRTWPDLAWSNVQQSWLENRAHFQAWVVA